MIKFVLKIINLNCRSLQIRSKQRTTSKSTKQQEMSFELSEFQFGTLKLTCNLRVHEPQIRIVNHDHIAVITWIGTHIIMQGSKRSNFKKGILKLKIQLLVLTKHLAKQHILIAQSILKLGDSQRKLSKDRSSLTLESKSEMFLEDLPMGQRPVKSPFLHLGFLSSSELEESSLEKSKSLRAAHARDMMCKRLLYVDHVKYVWS
jgi:hypothetical protein